MTPLTHAELAAAIAAAQDAPDALTAVAAIVAVCGRTMPEPEPPEEMVKLAWAIYLKTDAPDDMKLGHACALAALQFTAEKVREALKRHPGMLFEAPLRNFCNDLLASIGARHD